jgi:hypothetical protein
MKLFDLLIESNIQQPILEEFWAQCTPVQLQYYFVQDNCYAASQDLMEFLDKQKGIRNAEIVPIGRIVGGKKSMGWFQVDVPDTSLDAFTKDDIAKLRSQGLDPRKASDRQAYINNNNLTEEFCWIPHSWVEIRDRILDPSGFYRDGKSGQFDRMVKDKTNLSQRYKYF